jgi:hypothetical protein
VPVLAQRDRRIRRQRRSPNLATSQRDVHDQLPNGIHSSYTPTEIRASPAGVPELSRDLQDKDYPVEARSLGRTLTGWKHQIAAWHAAQVGKGPTEAVNNLIKRVKRAAFGFTSFGNDRIRSLLYAGNRNWDLLRRSSRRSS